MSNRHILFKTQVIKLGGTSQTKVGYDTLINNLDQNIKTVIVVSAMKDITNLLIKITSPEYYKYAIDTFNIIKEKNTKLATELELDISFLDEEFNFLLQMIKNINNINLQDRINIVSSGETITAKILNKYIETKELKTMYIDTTDFIDCNLPNDTLFNKGEFTVNINNFYSNFDSYNTIIVPGFRGKNINNEISLMGRGGSDTTGSLIASSLNSSRYQIWTDVNGIYSGDPNKINNVNIIPIISYDAAQEVSAMGASVIHPYCIKPCKQNNIPIEIRNTFNYNTDYTTIKCTNSSSDKAIYSITKQDNITIFKIQSLNMWNNYGFVYDIFSKFKDFNVDVNIINTSQFDITTTTNDTDYIKLEKLKVVLEQKYNVIITNNCSCISIVGENLKKYDKLDLVMKSLLDFDIKLTSYSSNDMTISFVVDNDTSSRLLNNIHQIIFPYNKFILPKNAPWWQDKLLDNGPEHCKYIYNLDIVKNKINTLKELSSIDRIYYAMKANNNESILLSILKLGIGIETVSINELIVIIKLIETYYSDIVNITNQNKVDILYTPNFADINDYSLILDYSNCSKYNIIIILDNINILESYSNVFRNKSIGLRLDLNYGIGHCSKVITQGEDSKFGMTPDEILSNISLFEDNQIKIIGIHSHMGSGITDYNHWINNTKLIYNLYQKIPNSINNIEWFNIGGGFGIDDTIDFNNLDIELSILKSTFSKPIKIFIEPGRFIVAESGIIWGRVTQIKNKNNTKFIGTNIGMTDLIRPALYSAIHPIYFKKNIIDSLSNSQTELVTIVGQICESGDFLIKNLLVNNNIKINDSIIVTNTGAYGIVMASNYNSRKLPEQLLY